MINYDDNPEEWIQFITELDEGREHLHQLVDELVLNKSIDPEHFAVQLGHVYAHLNRSWRMRSGPIPEGDEAWATASSFPSDIDVVG